MTCFGVHARLDDLQRHPAADRLRLLGDVDDAHAALADLLQQLVGADDRARGLERRGVAPGHGRGRDWLLEEVAGVLVGDQQGVDSRPEDCVALARPVQVGSSFRLGRAVQGFAEDRFEFGADRGHRMLLVRFLLLSAPSASDLRQDSGKSSRRTAGRSLSPPEPVVEPGSGERPVPVGRAPGEPEGLGGLALSEAREEAELHEARADGIVTLELLQSLVEREQVDVRSLSRSKFGV